MMPQRAHDQGALKAGEYHIIHVWEVRKVFEYVSYATLCDIRSDFPHSRIFT